MTFFGMMDKISVEARQISKFSHFEKCNIMQY